MKFLEGFGKAVKIIVGILLVLLGCMFLSMPVITTYVMIQIAGIFLIVMGALEFISVVVPKARLVRRPISIVTAIFKLFLGILLLIADKSTVVYLPIVGAIWLAAFGAYRIVLGIRHKRQNTADNWQTSVAVGVIAAIGAVMLALMNWFASVDMIGILLAVISMLYGFVTLLDAFVKSGTKTKEEILEEDKAIAESENAEYMEFKKKLKEK